MQYLTRRTANIATDFLVGRKQSRKEMQVKVHFRQKKFRFTGQLRIRRFGFESRGLQKSFKHSVKERNSEPQKLSSHIAISNLEI